jgi:hypothetical protein
METFSFETHRVLVEAYGEALDLLCEQPDATLAGLRMTSRVARSFRANSRPATCPEPNRSPDLSRAGTAPA